MQVLTGLLEQYGYAVLFIVLMLELLALLGPGEFAGVLVFQEKLNWVLSMLAAGLGSCAGVSMSYWIGYRLGPAAIQKAFASRGVLLAVIVLTFFGRYSKGKTGKSNSLSPSRWCESFMKRELDGSFIPFILFTLLWKVMYYIHSRANRL